MITETEERLIRVKEVKYMVGFSTGKIYDLMQKGEFPKQIKIGGSSVWRLSDIKDYISKVSKQAS
jgi:predicted DNA-binding transcriptional regulator AlpA